jgi:plasmid replication initiation protein
MNYYERRERVKVIDYEYILTDAEYWEQERNHLVVKHNSIIQKTRYSLSTQQQKVLLYTISKIQPGDDDFKEYVFELKDLCILFGIDNHGQNYDNFRDNVKKLADASFWLLDKDRNSVLVRWFSKVIISNDNTKVNIRFDADLKPWLLELAGQFTQYELSNTLLMKSRYSIRIYEILKSYEAIGMYKTDLETLKVLLDCAGDYKIIGDFKRRVLDVAMAEINEYSDLEVEYTLLRTNRAYTHIMFSINRKDRDRQVITMLKNSARFNHTAEESEIAKW